MRALFALLWWLVVKVVVNPVEKLVSTFLCAVD
jgi:hypothetical protein